MCTLDDVCESGCPFPRWSRQYWVLYIRFNVNFKAYYCNWLSMTYCFCLVLINTLYIHATMSVMGLWTWIYTRGMFTFTIKNMSKVIQSIVLYKGYKQYHSRFNLTSPHRAILGGFEMRYGPLILIIDTSFSRPLYHGLLLYFPMATTFSHFWPQ